MSLLQRAAEEWPAFVGFIKSHCPPDIKFPDKEDKEDQLSLTLVSGKSMVICFHRDAPAINFRVDGDVHTWEFGWDGDLINVGNERGSLYPEEAAKDAIAWFRAVARPKV